MYGACTVVLKEGVACHRLSGISSPGLTCASALQAKSSRIKRSKGPAVPKVPTANKYVKYHSLQSHFPCGGPLALAVIRVGPMYTIHSRVRSYRRGCL
jgi:hypothetical protein